MVIVLGLELKAEIGVTIVYGLSLLAIIFSLFIVIVNIRRGRDGTCRLPC